MVASSSTTIPISLVLPSSVLTSTLPDCRRSGWRPAETAAAAAAAEVEVGDWTSALTGDMALTDFLLDLDRRRCPDLSPSSDPDIKERKIVFITANQGVF